VSAEHQVLLGCYAEPHLSYAKIVQGERRTSSFTWMLCWTAAYLMQR